MCGINFCEDVVYVYKDKWLVVTGCSNLDPFCDIEKILSKRVEKRRDRMTLCIAHVLLVESRISSKKVTGFAKNCKEDILEVLNC